MQLQEVLAELKALGRESIRNVYVNYGAREPFWGVRIGDMKTIVKKIKNDQVLAMQLFDTGISDAMYLAGLVADGSKMSKAELQKWANNSGWNMIADYTVPWVASESQYAQELALEWIDSDSELMASSGWNTLSCIVGMKPDIELDLTLYLKLLKRVENCIHQSQNLVRYAMNNFVIALGAGVMALTDNAMAVARQNGTIQVNMGKTACTVPFAPDYIQKIIDMGKLGRKKKTMKC
ncbi:MAG: DNA alkylation repair protein [Bacteroidia bacterium]